jgi:hypothetical protein
MVDITDQPKFCICWIAGFNVVQRPVCITDITTAIEFRMCWNNLISPMLAGNAVIYLTSDYRLRIS